MKTAAAVLFLVLAVRPAIAHHAFAAEFDAKKPVKIRGTVTKMEWINPHAWIHIDVKKPDGTVEEWMIEAGTPNTLLRRGFTKDSLKAGTEVVVDGYQSTECPRIHSAPNRLSPSQFRDAAVADSNRMKTVSTAERCKEISQGYAKNAYPWLISLHRSTVRIQILHKHNFVMRLVPDQLVH